MTKRYLTGFNDNNLYGEYDVIIIGSGIAGLYTGLMLDKSLKILVVSKSTITESNSYLAQGGIAASMSEEEAISHVEDTIVAGCNHNDIEAVTKMIGDSKENIDELISLRVPFDRSVDGTIHMTKEGGHSVSRILHVLDKTGEGIIETLIFHTLKRENITICENVYAVDVITCSDKSSDKSTACGILMIKDKNVYTVKSRAVVIASGGIGNIYDRSTNSSNSTGDGIGIAARAGAKFKDMEFVQFHPTAFIPSKEGHSGNSEIESLKPLLISEAVRGEGGRLVNSDGEYFMENVHPLKDLAPRNIVSETIFNELDAGKRVFIDFSGIDSEYIKNRFPNIYTKMAGFGYDITKQLVPVSPVQHYFMGGIKVDLYGKTSVSGIYSCGEASNTGVHGANRLASNSLLEAIVYGRRVARHIDENIAEMKKKRLDYEYSFTHIDDNKKIDDDFAMKSIEKIKNIMSESASIIRDTSRLNDAIRKMSDILESLEMFNMISVLGCEAYNMAICSKLILKAACERKNTLGTHIVRNM